VSPGRGQILTWRSSVGVGFFELYELQPLAGRFFSQVHPLDEMPQNSTVERPDAVVVNESFFCNLGVAYPQAAI
jgi:hypothetical protein